MPGFSFCFYPLAEANGNNQFNFLNRTAIPPPSPKTMGKLDVLVTSDR
jgi:hypothetical protein